MKMEINFNFHILVWPFYGHIKMKMEKAVWHLIFNVVPRCNVNYIQMQIVKQRPPVYYISIYMSPSFVENMKMEIKSVSPLINAGLQLGRYFI